MSIEYLESLKLLETESGYYNIDFRSGKELKKCSIKLAEKRLLVIDGSEIKYIVDPDSIEKISAFKDYIVRKIKKGD